MIGKTIAHYRITGKLGQGGMGEVYQARDGKLNRDVALKLLPESTAGHPERMARFEREAKMLAALNHASIAQIYGIEDTGVTKALILECVAGETLAEQIARGSIPAEEAMEIALQIAAGLEAAHEKGIIHRDLKPSNVKITPDGRVKILDFGLAKALEAESMSPDPQAPHTLTHGATDTGVILGTTLYMSPEQARGKPVDKRTDIWSFGCVLFEMLTGSPPFRGDSPADILGSVVRDEPDWKMLPPSVSIMQKRLLKRCLQKDPLNRLRDIGDFRLEAGDPFPHDEGKSIPERDGENRRLPKFLITASVLAVFGWALAAWLLLKPGGGVPALQVSQFSIGLSPEQAVDTKVDHQPLAISSDGRRICWIGDAGGENSIFTRSLDSLEILKLPGTEDAMEPVFSPDGREIAFIRGPSIFKTLFEGGEVTEVYKLDTSGDLRSVAWLDDDSLAFSSHDSDLWRIPSSGGPREVLTPVVSDNKEKYLHHPSLLPGFGKMILSVAVGNFNDCHIELLSLDSGSREIIIKKAYAAAFSPTGHLLFGREGQIWAVPFDPDSGQPTGPETSVLSGVQMDDYGRIAQAVVAGNGTLVYAPGRQSLRKLSWISLDGEIEHIDEPPRLYSDPRISPDGRWVALMRGHYHERRLWLYDLERSSFQQITFDGSVNRNPVWNPDGDRLAYQSNEAGQYDVFLKQIGSDSPSTRVMSGEGLRVPYSWSPDGETIAFVWFEGGATDIWLADAVGGQDPEPFITTEFSESQPVFSPDGTWLAYVSDEEVIQNVYARRVKGGEMLRKISRNGGSSPVWAPRDGAIYYASNDGTRIYSVTVREKEPYFGEEKMLLENLSLPPPIRVGTVWSYDIAPDGSRFFVVNEVQESTENRLVIITNWLTNLKESFSGEKW